MVETWWAENFAKCEHLMDKHVEVFETCHGRIQNNDCEDVTRQCFSYSSKVQSRPFCDFHMLLGLFCLLPLLEVVNVLIKYAQGRDVFICDFVATIKICQTNLYMMFSDPSNNYQHEHFQVFSNVVENNYSTII